MSVQDFAKLLRSRWRTVAITVLIALFGAVVYSLTTTPLYEASTRLFVSTTAGATATDLYQGNRLSQDRVLSYTELLMGETLAKRTLDKLDLDLNADQLRGRVKAKAVLDTVLIDVSVRDESPVRARDLANALSDEFVTLVKELETPRPGAQPDARVIVEQRASIPNDPVVPKTARNTAIGMFLGIALGIGFAVLRDQFDTTVKDTETLEQITSVGLVGMIPLDKERRIRPAISFDTDYSAIAESFRKLRTNLQFLTVDNPPRVIVVASSAPNEGKSTTAINIALALAEAEENVVLVDGDLRRPSLHTYLDLVERVGFSTVLSRSAKLDEVLQKTRFPNLTVMTAGARPPNPSELLSSRAAQRVLDELREKFDYVVVDSPPLLAVTDGAILSAKADGALLVVRFGVTKCEQLAHAIGALSNVGASLLGSIFTMTTPRGASSYGYSYSYYSKREDGNTGVAGKSPMQTADSDKRSDTTQTPGMTTGSAPDD